MLSEDRGSEVWIESVGNQIHGFKSGQGSCEAGKEGCWCSAFKVGEAETRAKRGEDSLFFALQLVGVDVKNLCECFCCDVLHFSA